MLRKTSRPGPLVSPEDPGDESLFWDARNSYDPHADVCPSCGHVGLRLASTYRRRMLTVVGGERAGRHVWVPCVRCGGCGDCRHALLFDVLIPFTSYTLLFIMTVPDTYLNRTTRVLDVCADWGIRPNTPYSWKRRFISHYNAYLNRALGEAPVNEPQPGSAEPSLTHCGH